MNAGRPSRPWCGPGELGYGNSATVSAAAARASAPDPVGPLWRWVRALRHFLWGPVVTMNIRFVSPSRRVKLEAMQREYQNLNDERHAPLTAALPSIGELDLEARQALRRVAGLASSELADVADAEYRRLRLEQVVLVGVWTEGTAEDAENSLSELAALAETAGALVVEGFFQRRFKPDPGTFIGSGKVREVKDVVEALGADTVICDGELSPGQLIALEKAVNVKVIDRTSLILDIFAQHAKSAEGKAQVELAQLQYLLPRLRGWGESMSRQAGGQAAGGEGIGSRGPGETKIELDRRRIRNRMAKLRREIAAM